MSRTSENFTMREHDMTEDTKTVEENTPDAVEEHEATPEEITREAMSEQTEQQERPVLTEAEEEAFVDAYVEAAVSGDEEKLAEIGNSKSPSTDEQVERTGRAILEKLSALEEKTELTKTICASLNMILAQLELGKLDREHKERIDAEEDNTDSTTEEGVEPEVASEDEQSSK